MNLSIGELYSFFVVTYSDGIYPKSYCKLGVQIVKWKQIKMICIGDEYYGTQ